MQAKLDVIKQAAREFEQMQGQMDNSVSQLGRFSSKYGDITSVANYMDEIRRMQTLLDTSAVQLGQCGHVLMSISELYSATEKKITDYCDGVPRKVLQKGLEDSGTGAALAGGMSGNSLLWLSGDWDNLLEANDDLLKIIKEPLDNVKKLLDIPEELLGDEEFLKDFRDILGDIKDEHFLKVADFISKGKELVEHWQQGDVNGVEKDIKGFAKSVIKEASGLSGIDGGVYIDWGLNMGKGIADGMQQIIEDPSVGTIAGTAWNTLVGSYVDAVWSAGTKLGATGLKVLYGVTGNQFDQNDYDTAMDFLKGVIGECASGVFNTAAQVGKNMLDGTQSFVASWFQKLF